MLVMLGVVLGNSGESRYRPPVVREAFATSVKPANNPYRPEHQQKRNGNCGRESIVGSNGKV